MGDMNKEVKRMLKRCVNCGHAEAVHQRIDMRKEKYFPSHCNVCKQVGKICKSFVEK
jgi:hypothetical protein